MQFIDDLGLGDWIDLMHAKGAGDIDREDPRNVCARCLPDRGIGNAIEYFSCSRRCDFCDRRFRSDKAAPITDIAQFVIGCLRQDYDTPESTLFFDKESESGFAGTVYDKRDLIQDYILAGWDVTEALIECVTDDHLWCQGDQALFLPGRQLGESWESFSRYVKHRSRFMFLRSDERPRGILDEPDDHFIPTTNMLDMVGEAVCAGRLIKTISRSTRIYRARPVKARAKWHSSAADLGTPPQTEYGPPAGRMSPAGIPIFYGALEEATAVTEALESDGKVAVGIFSPLRPLVVLDLTGKEPLPYRSIFENVTSTMRGLQGFVAAFSEDIARTTTRDGREHIDYVPSQIVTEYFRRVFLVDGETRLDGILYPSTRNPDGRNIALFVGSDEIQGISRWKPSILRFHPRSVRRYRVLAVKGRVASWRKAKQ